MNAANGDGKRLVLRFSWLKEMLCDRRVIHSFKVGLALVLVSLIYLIDPVFDQLGENVIWSIMTVVVMFEFYAGATLGKGINRILGTTLGGGLGCLAALLAEEIGGLAKPIFIASSIFVFSAAATYCRLMPRFKKRYDYGFMIFVLTFNLVAVSGVRAEDVVEVGRDRIAAIGIGFAVCVFVSLFVCPIWASNEIHYSTASKFDKLAIGLQGCLDEYFKTDCHKENQAEVSTAYVQACKSVLNSKFTDESMVNHAKWEPWHGKFGLSHPWVKYLEVGEHLRELASTILALKGCLQSPKQPPAAPRQTLKESCEIFALSIQWILKELGESVGKMELYDAKGSISPKLQTMKLRLSPQLTLYGKMEVIESDEYLAISSFNFMLLEIVDKVEKLAQKVEELGKVANFRVRKIDV